MKYKELKELFCQHESTFPSTHLTAYITFCSFGPENKNDYTWEARTYVVSSDNKAFQPNMGGYSIFGSCLDGGDRCIRLEHFMADEHGGKNGWVVEDCCMIGYLLVESDGLGGSTPKMFYSIDEARDTMLSRITSVIEIGPESLKAAYAESNCCIVAEDHMADRFVAWARQGSDGKLWAINPTYIYGPMDIIFTHGQT